MHVYVLTLIQEQFEGILMCIRFYVSFYVTESTKSCFIRQNNLFNKGTFERPPPLDRFFRG